MSRNSKNTRKLSLARQFSKIRKSGGSGPKRTVKLTKKVNTFWAKKKLGLIPSKTTKNAATSKDDDSTTETV